MKTFRNCSERERKKVIRIRKRLKITLKKMKTKLKTATKKEKLLKHIRGVNSVYKAMNKKAMSEMIEETCKKNINT